ncbi:MAG: LamG domain-containing protein [Alphaproteobacteria bacterium]|nr:LamG domain-containing protein [Alphaproteobacteria bacterium]
MAPRKSLLVYADRVAAAPGETVRFMASSETGSPFDYEIIRVRCGDAAPGGAGYKVDAVAGGRGRVADARRQPVAAGSYAVVPGTWAVDGAFTLQAYVMPTTPARGWQGLIGWWSEPTECGFGLFIDDKAQVLVAIGDGKGEVDVLRAGKPLVAGLWYLIAATYDRDARALRLIQEVQSEHKRLDLDADVAMAPTVRELGRPSVPLTMATIVTETDGAWNAGAFFNGRIEAPRLDDTALDRAAIQALAGWPVPAALEPRVLAAWDFGHDIPGTGIHDRSAHRRHGELVNLPTRAVPGRAWTGAVHDWRQDPTHYGAIHFHEDDLYDAGWTPSFAFTVPEDLRGGLYAARVWNDADESFATFVVRPPRGRASAPIAFLASTATYTAYVNIQWSMLNQASEMRMGGLTVLDADDVTIYERPELGLSAYDLHVDGSPVYYATRRRPCLNWAPRTGLWSFNADTHVTDWLEAKGHAYDVVTDDDLHADGVDRLAPYRVVVTGAHPEYWSTPMWDAMTAYLRGGGRLMYLGGNGFYWRIAFHRDLPDVIEVRRAETGARYWAAEPGAYHHAFTGELGGLWRRVGCPPNRLVGIGTVVTGFDRSSYYRRTPASRGARAAWIFDGLAEDERIGDFGILGGGAAGFELDAADPALGTPPHALVVARSEAHSYYYLLVPEETLFHHPAINGLEDDGVRAEMVFFEGPNGGAVFSTGSIIWAASLAHAGYDNNVSRVTDNVLRRFTDPASF